MAATKWPTCVFLSSTRTDRRNVRMKIMKDRLLLFTAQKKKHRTHINLCQTVNSNRCKTVVIVPQNAFQSIR